MKDTTYDSLTQKEKELLDEAEKAMETAYNPYSKFFVGAAILTSDGSIISASNVENSAYGSCICAERMALGKANSMKKRVLDSIAIIARGEDFKTKEPSAPCGSCRQMLYEASEVSGKDMKIILSNTDKSKIIITSIKELLPMPFGPLDLGIDVNKYRA